MHMLRTCEEKLALFILGKSWIDWIGVLGLACPITLACLFKIKTRLWPMLVKFNLPHIWDRVLLNTPGLNLKRHAKAVGHANSNTPLSNQPNFPPKINDANYPSQVLSMHIEPPRTYISYNFQFSLKPDEVHSSGWKLVYHYNQTSVPERNYLFLLHEVFNTILNES